MADNTSFEISGTIERIFEVQTLGTNGFQKREFVVNTGGQYPQKIKLELVKDKCSLLDKFNEGDAVTVGFNLRGVEVNDKFWNSLVAWKIFGANAGGNGGAPRQQSQGSRQAAPRQGSGNARPAPRQGQRAPQRPAPQAASDGVDEDVPF